MCHKTIFCTPETFSFLDLPESEPEPAISKADKKKAKKDAKKGGKKNKGKKTKAVDAEKEESAVVAQNPLHQDDVET